MTRSIKLLSLSLLVLAGLAGCGNEIKNNFDARDYRESEARYAPICLDGVEYWARSAHNQGYLAVRIDPATLQPKRCISR